MYKTMIVIVLLAYSCNLNGQIIIPKTQKKVAKKLNSETLDLFLGRYGYKKAFSKTIKADFTWRRASKNYGFDNNNNGIIDLPNSYEYATNQHECPCANDEPNCIPQFKIIFDPGATQWPRLPGFTTRVDRENNFIEREDSPNGGIIARQLSQVGQMDEQDAELANAEFRSRMRGYKWEIDGEEVEMERVGNEKIFSLCLKEGDYEIQMTAIDYLTGEENSISKRVIVEDFLIICLGDSYASGEGNPEKSYIAEVTIDESSFGGWLNFITNMDGILAQAGFFAADKYNGRYRNESGGKAYVSFPVWADDGNMPSLTNKTFSLENFPVQVLIDGDIHTVYVTILVNVEGIPDYNGFSDQAQAHDRSHRSSFCSTSQAALEIENLSDQYSVTYLNLAMSGATVPHGFSGDYDGLRGSRFYDGNNPMQSQLDQLVPIAQSREIDAVFMSIGGNDIGFANAVAAFVVREPGGRLSSQNISLNGIREAVISGDWGELENQIGSVFALYIQSEVNWNNLAGLEGLPNAYDHIEQQLVNLSIRPNIKNIYISEYPDPTSEMPDYNRPDELYYCAPILQNIKWPLEIGNAEITTAYEDMLLPLNSMVRLAAQRHDWTLISGVGTISIGNGLCGHQPYDPNNYQPSHPVQLYYPSRKRWFRRAVESSIIQSEEKSETSGTVHPNEYGHAAIKDRIMQTIALPQINF